MRQAASAVARPAARDQTRAHSGRNVHVPRYLERFFGPLIYLTKTSTYTLALDFQVWAVTQQAAGAGYKPQPFDRVMAVATLITLVPVAIFFVLQRYFQRGIVIRGPVE